MMPFFNFIVSFLTSKWGPISIAASAMAAVYSNFMGIMGQIDDLVSAMNGVTAESLGSHGVSIGTWSLMNYVVPLDLCIALFVIWLPLLVTCATIRLIKSFVPTVAS